MMAYINILIKCNFEVWHLALIPYTKKCSQLSSYIQLVSRHFLTINVAK